MSNKVIEFYSKAVKDEQFVKSLEKFRTENSTEKAEAIGKVVLPYAKKLGYSFTKDELLNSLTEKELSQIAGGWFGSALVAATTALAGFMGFGGGEALPVQQSSPSTVRQQEYTEQNIVRLLQLTDNGDETYTLNGISDKNISGEVIIPSEVNGRSITRINKCAFQACKNITALVIPSTIQFIGDSAFDQCFGIESITFEFGSHLHTIEKRAFSGCANLKVLEIPNGVRHIAPNTFFNCVELNAISIPGTVISIAPDAFSHCNNLKYVRAPGHLQTQLAKNHIFPASCEVEYN